MSAVLDQLTLRVTENTSVTESAIALLQNIKAQLDAAGTDQVALQALSDSLGSETQKLADAVTANTPTQP